MENANQLPSTPETLAPPSGKSMISDPNFSNQNIPIQWSKKKILVAILLGFLTFVITPIIALIIAIPFFLLGKASENFNPIIIIAGIFGLQDLGGFFAAQFILILFIALIGDLGTATISWFINRSKKLAVITFIAAFIFQLVTLIIVIPATINKSQQTIQSGIDREKAFEQFAQIGDISYETQEPYSDNVITNLHPEYGTIYAKLEIVIPVSVSHAGIYQITAQYSFSKDGTGNTTPIKNIIQNFEAGDHIAKIEFLANEAGGNYGYWSPKFVGGKADVQLSYLTSQKEILGSLKSDKTVDQKVLQQFMKDEGLDKKTGSESTVTKYVGRKEAQF